MSGGILTSACENNKVEAYYLAGTEPIAICEYHQAKSSDYTTLTRLQENHMKSGYYYNSRTDFTPLVLPDLSFLKSDKLSEELYSEDEGESEFSTSSNIHSIEEFDGNWLLD